MDMPEIWDWQTCARNIWLLIAKLNISVDFVHIPGEKNNAADLLSRWKSTPKIMKNC